MAKKSKTYFYANYISKNIDMDYLKTLNKKEKDYMNEFIETYYNGNYTDDFRKSIFRSQKALDLIKLDPQKYERFKHKKTKYNNKHNVKLNDLDFLVIWFCQKGSKEKRIAERCETPMRYTSILREKCTYRENVIEDSKIIYEHETKQNLYDEELLDLHNNVYKINLSDEENNLYDAIKSGKLPEYIYSQLIKIIDNNDISNKIDLIKSLNATQQQFNEDKLTQLKYVSYLYKIHLGIKLLNFEDKEIKVLDNIFEMVVYNQDKKTKITWR